MPGSRDDTPASRNEAASYVTGDPPVSTKLLVIRGNSGSGKSTVAKEVRRRYGRGMALVEQDYLRRIVLRERDGDGAIAPELIAQTARFALAHGYHVVLEGIMVAHRYASMIAALFRDHRGDNILFYLDVSLPETLRRHTLRPQASEFTAEEMRGWYQPHDVLGFPGELVIPEDSSFEATVDFIERIAGLSTGATGPLGGGVRGGVRADPSDERVVVGIDVGR